MDLSLLTPGLRTARMVLKHPITGAALTTEDGAEVCIICHAQDSPIYESAQEALASEIADEAQDGEGKVDAVVLRKQARKRGWELLAKLIVGWEHLGFGGEESVPYTPERALEMLNALPFVRRQFAEYVEQTSNWVNAEEGN